MAMCSKLRRYIWYLRLTIDFSGVICLSNTWHSFVAISYKHLTDSNTAASLTPQPEHSLGQQQLPGEQALQC